ncbi:preprotein translocase subunit YajC [Desulfopila sp. IMCC35008]|uniref:preprotein translocase subunit YajC n=1 Tax=Desulfopila sp. IMCC35008 TaxID=2653858 RepID=UPI0013D7281B|nr:preprotein translocase subunit YajC [Desulfopila sp. IMCC35008]
MDGAAAAGSLGAFGNFIPLILIFVVFYFLLIRPQQKQAKQHQQFLADLKKNTRVMTKGGMYGVITNIDNNVLTIEIAKDIEVKVSRDAIASAVNKDGSAVTTDKAGKEVKKPSGG